MRLAPNSLRGLIRLLEAAFVVLVLVTAALGGMWAYFWQQSSVEAVQINSLLSEAQVLRGDVFREIKEVTRAQLINEPTALEKYWAALYRIDFRFNQLANLTANAHESKAVDEMRKSYELMQTEMNKLFVSALAMSEGARIEQLDPAYERLILGDFETAFQGLVSLISSRRAELERNLARWNQLAPTLISVPIVAALGLLLFSRWAWRAGFVRPMEHIIQGATRMSAGDLATHINPHGVSELNTLAGSINDMARDLAASRDALLAKERQAALGALVPVVAHNIRNPLASIRASAQVADFDQPEELEELRTGIIDSVDRLERWVSSLLSYLHPLKPHPRSALLAQVIDGAEKPLRPKATQKSIRVERSDWDETIAVTLDVDLMEQALHGLINNAIEASPEGGVVRLSLSSDALQASVGISDEGTGMTTPQIPQDLSPGPSTKPMGTGLGIPFAFKVVRAHGGHIDFERAHSGGTQVTVQLPLPRPENT